MRPIGELLDEADRDLLRDRNNYHAPVWNVIHILRRQEERITALERSYPAPAPPLEGVRPLPLERKEG